MEELSKKFCNTIESRCPDADMARVKEELHYFEDTSLLKDVQHLVNIVEDNPERRGDKNEPNSAVLFYLGATSCPHDSSNPLSVPKRRTYGRAGFPDIDMDFDYEKRHLIDEYLIQKYGGDKVAKIGTVQQLKTKAAVRRVIKVLDPENSVVFDKHGKRVKDDRSLNFQLEQKVLSCLPGLMKRADGSFVNSVKAAAEEYELFGRYMREYPEVYRVARHMEGGISAFGCLAKDTLIKTDKGWVRIDQLDETCKVAYLDKDGEVQYTSDYVPHMTGTKQLYKMRLENGDFIKVTDEHLIFTDKGCVRFEEIRKNPKNYKVLSVKE
jgi:hypothetical protein